MLYFDLENKRVYRDLERIQLPKEKGNLADRPKTWNMVRILAQKPDGTLVPYECFQDDTEQLQRHMRAFLKAIGENTRSGIFAVENGVGYRVNKKDRFCVVKEGDPFFDRLNDSAGHRNEPDDGKEASVLQEDDLPPTDYHQLKQELFETQIQMDQLIQKMEEIHCRLEQAESKNNPLWVKVYSAQLDACCDMLQVLRLEAARQCDEMSRMMAEYEGHYQLTLACEREHHADRICCSTDPMLMLRRELLQQKTWLESATLQVHNLESEIDEIICAYLCSSDDEASYKVQEALESLPLTRATASALYETVIHSYDGMIELYDVLFNRYREYLLTEEYEELVKQAKAVFDPEVVEGWLM